MFERTVITLLTAATALVPAVAGASSAGPDGAGRAPTCTPPPPPPMPPAGQFVATVTNRYFPLHPGTTFVYRGQEEGDQVVDTVTVTGATKTILGVAATVVRDSVQVNGRPS